MKNPLNDLSKLLLVLVLGSFVWSCDEDEPQKEDTPELITKVTLTFTPEGGGTTVVVTTKDPDNIGSKDIVADGPISLKLNTTYSLAITLINGLADPADEDYNITNEVLEEADEHMFFFAWTGGFSNPEGDGNIDNRADIVRYEDADENGLPIGLATIWTTASIVATGNTFTILLKHQPDLKSATSTSEDGETDVNLEFDLEIVE
jgi:hypothetical protein